MLDLISGMLQAISDFAKSDRAAFIREVQEAQASQQDSMMPGMVKEAGTTEELKARDPMRWVGQMNCCKSQVEEIIFAELIYI